MEGEVCIRAGAGVRCGRVVGVCLRVVEGKGTAGERAVTAAGPEDNVDMIANAWRASGEVSKCFTLPFKASTALWFSSIASDNCKVHMCDMNKYV